jgi:hypothetical protein
LLNPRKTKISKGDELLDALEFMESDSSACANNYLGKNCDDKPVIFKVDGFFGHLTLMDCEVSCRKLWLMDDVDNSPPESLVEGVVSLCKNA